MNEVIYVDLIDTWSKNRFNREMTSHTPLQLLSDRISYKLEKNLLLREVSTNCRTKNWCRGRTKRTKPVKQSTIQKTSDVKTK